MLDLCVGLRVFVSVFVCVLSLCSLRNGTYKKSLIFRLHKSEMSPQQFSGLRVFVPVPVRALVKELKCFLKTP